MAAGDAAGAAWLRSVPSYGRPDINGARLLAIGAALGMDEEDRTAFLPALRPLFGDAGFPIDAPHPSPWFLRLPHGAKLPAFAEQADALGPDLLDQPAEGRERTAGRVLLVESQVVRHIPPRNDRLAHTGRLRCTQPWFWGCGRLSAVVRSLTAAFIS